MTTLNHKTVVICVPTYNEERYISECLTSISKQTYSDFLCVIRDNGSSDNTERLCREFVDVDVRFTFLRSAVNKGAASNFEELFFATESPYFMWVGSHDRLSPIFLEAALSRLEKTSDAVCCYSRTKWIDENGNCIRLSSGGEYVTFEPRPLRRFAKLAGTFSGECAPINGLMRRSAFDCQFSCPVYDGPDIYIISKLALKGHIIRIEEHLYEYRHFATRAQTSHERITGQAELNPSSLRKNYWPLIVDQTKAVLESEAERPLRIWYGAALFVQLIKHHHPRLPQPWRKIGYLLARAERGIKKAKLSIS